MNREIVTVPCGGEEHRILKHSSGAIVLLDHSREEDQAEGVARAMGGRLHGCWAVRAQLIYNRKLLQRQNRWLRPTLLLSTHRPYLPWDGGVVQRARNLVPRELVDDLSLSELVAYRRAHPVRP